MKLVFNPFTGNLDYVASSPGDVGIVFPLAPNLGGTGIANAAGSTLTLGGATTISGGGTIVLGGFTLTVPATLTAAGLAIANVFTANQKINVNSTTALFVEQDGVKDNLFIVDTANGSIGMGLAPGTGALLKLLTPAVGTIGIYLFGMAGQTADLQQWVQGGTSNYGAVTKAGTYLASGNQNSAYDGVNIRNLNSGSSALASFTVSNNLGYIGQLSFYSSTYGLATLQNQMSVSSRTGIVFFTDLATATGGTSIIKFITGGYNNAASVIYNADGSMSILGRDAAALDLSVAGITTTNNAIKSVARLEARVSTASTGGAAGFGVGLDLFAETATDGTYQQQGLISTSWVDATNATRKATLALSAYDTAERKGIEIRANGSTPDIALLGDTWWEGEGFGLPYGSCSSNDTDINWTQAAAVQNTWYDISDADMVDGQLNLVTHDGSGQLTVTKGGRYLINYGLVAESNAANTHLETAISVSGTESGFGISHAEAVTPNVERNFNSTAILDLAANATINLSIRTTDAGGPNLKVEMMDITLVMVGGT